MAGESDTFREEHAISRQVWDARPFERYQRSSSEAARVKELYEGSGLRKGQLADIAKIVTNRRDGCEGGLIIHRHAARGEPHVYPQLRPDKPVARDLIFHWHGDDPPSEPPVHPGTGTPIPEVHIYLKPAKGWGRSMLDHIEKGADGRPAAPDENLHRGSNVEGLHSHQVLAKYVFPSTPLVDEEYTHTHLDYAKREQDEDRRQEKLAAHIAKNHKNDERQIALDEPHTHIRPVKDTSNPLARRLDVEPRFYELLENSNVVYFGIEGSVKGSALTSAGVPAFTVPSVTMWDAHELDRFAAKFLTGKIIVIVPDNDWYTNPDVIAQAYLCRTYLRRQLNQWALIAAPPANELTADGKLEKVGVDDYRKMGFDLLDMDVISRNANIPLYREWIAEHLPRKTPDRARRTDYIKTLAVALEGLALHATQGQVQLLHKSIARVMGLHERTVNRAITDLLESGAITSDREVKIKQGVYTPGLNRWNPLGLEFVNRPVFTVAPELQIEDESKKLRDALNHKQEYWDDLAYLGHLNAIEGGSTTFGQAFAGIGLASDEPASKAAHSAATLLLDDAEAV